MKSGHLIRDLVKQGENKSLEFKELPRKEAIGKAICAFLNGEGGQVLVGIKESGDIVGVSNAKIVAYDLEQYLIKEIVPEAPVTVAVEEDRGKEFIIAKVSTGSKKPYIFQGSIFFRRGVSTVPASSKDVSELIHNQQQTMLPWERQLALGVELEDLDLDEINQTIKSSISAGRTKDTKKEIIDFLEYYGLYRNGHFTNGSVILFAKEPFRFLPQCRVRIAVFSSKKTGSNFLYDKVFDGNIFKNVNSIQEFFDVNIGTGSSFKKGNWQRKDKLNYPKDALREAVLNSLIHRDYSNISGNVLIGFYPDRLEISNYGSLPKDITIAALKRNHLSLPVNPDIAQMCFLRGWVEQIGRGIAKIIEQCRDFDFKDPIWTSSNNVTTVTFPGITIVTKDFDGKIKGVSDVISDVVNNVVNNAINDGLIDGVSDGVKSNLNRVVKLLYEKPGLIADEISRNIKKAKPSIERYIKILRTVELIEFKGPSKTGGYYLTKETSRRIENK